MRARNRHSYALAIVVFAGIPACNAITGVGDFGVGSEPNALDDDGGDDTTDTSTGGGSTRRDGGGRTDTGPDEGTDADVTTDGGSPDPSDDAATDEDTGVVDPPEEDSGVVTPTSKRVFVTSAKVQGAFGGIATADGMCADAASQGGLGGSWVAWLSTPSVNAVDRLTFDGTYKLLDGTKIASNKAQLVSGSIDAPISITENKGPVTEGENWVWTGTTPNGQKSSYTCSNWSTTSPVTYGVVGNFGYANTKWTEQGSPGFGFPAYGCQTWGHIYCFEK